MYRLHDYARMIADTARIAAYVRALEACVRPGTVVIDIGTGTGIFALVACRLGARRVYAIDTNEVIEVGRELARENGCADRIEFIQGDLFKVKLPERGHVVISDDRGGLPLAGSNLAALTHARERLLAPGGTMIPLRDRLFVAVVSSTERYGAALGPAVAGGAMLAAMRAHLANTVHKDRGRTVRSEHLLTSGLVWANLDFASTQSAPVRGRAEWRIERSAVGHGLVLWFETDLLPSIGFSTAPGLTSVYPQLFLPWSEPVSLREGDRVAVDLWGQPEGEPWGWNTIVTRADSTKGASFRQSSLQGLAVSPVRLRAPRKARKVS